MARSNEVICLSLADEHIKIAHIKGAGPGAKLAHVATRSVAGLTDVEIIAALEKLLKSFPGKSARYVAVVPASMVTTKNIEIPSSDEGEIQSIVNLQASRHTPLSREEIQIGYINLGSKKSNYSQVLLTIANRLQLKDQVKIFEKAGIKASQLIFAPEAIAELYGRSRLQGEREDPWESSISTAVRPILLLSATAGSWPAALSRSAGKTSSRTRQQPRPN